MSSNPKSFCLFFKTSIWNLENLVTYFGFTCCFCGLWCGLSFMVKCYIYIHLPIHPFSIKKDTLCTKSSRCPQKKKKKKNTHTKKFSRLKPSLKGALSGLRQFSATESHLKMIKMFLFYLKSSFHSQDI